MSSSLIDDAKVRRFLVSTMDYYFFLQKKWLSFDVCQSVVCEHTLFVLANTIFLPTSADVSKIVIPYYKKRIFSQNILLSLNFDVPLHSQYKQSGQVRVYIIK